MAAKLEIKPAILSGGYVVIWEDIPSGQHTYYPVLKRGTTLYSGDAIGSASGIQYNPNNRSISQAAAFASSETYDLYLSPSQSDITGAVAYGTGLIDPLYNQTTTAAIATEILRYDNTIYNGVADPATRHPYSDNCVLQLQDTSGNIQSSMGNCGLYVYTSDPGTAIGDTTLPDGYIASNTYADRYTPILSAAHVTSGQNIFGYLADGDIYYLLLRDTDSNTAIAIIKVRGRVNVAPSDITISQTTLQKVAGRTAPYVFGDISTTDVNENDNHTYEITSQTLSGVAENVFFTGCGKFLALGTVEAGTHTVVIKASDGIASYTKSFTITVTGAEAGSLTSPTDFTATANSANSVELTFTLPSGITSDTTITWQRASVDPDGENFDPATDWTTIATTDIYGVAHTA